MSEKHVIHHQGSPRPDSTALGFGDVLPIVGLVGGAVGGAVAIWLFLPIWPWLLGMGLIGGGWAVYRHFTKLQRMASRVDEIRDTTGTLEPIPLPTLRAIEGHLHAVIRGRAARFIDQSSWPLPSLAAMLAGEASESLRRTGNPDVWFYPVPGMHGGFRLRWLAGGADAKLESVSFCRVAGGSGQRHEITAAGGELVESGMLNGF